MVTRGCVVFKAFFALGVTCAGNWRDNASFLVGEESEVYSMRRILEIVRYLGCHGQCAKGMDIIDTISGLFIWRETRYDRLFVSSTIR